jgi:hypothetical protein
MYKRIHNRKARHKPEQISGHNSSGIIQTNGSKKLLLNIVSTITNVQHMAVKDQFSTGEYLFPHSAH